MTHLELLKRWRQREAGLQFTVTFFLTSSDELVIHCSGESEANSRARKGCELGIRVSGEKGCCVHYPAWRIVRAEVRCDPEEYDAVTHACDAYMAATSP